MKLIKYQGRLPECLEGFPQDCERSVEGSIHLRPGQTVELTDDEFAHIKTNRPKMTKDLVVLREWKAEPKAKPKAEPEAKSE